MQGETMLGASCAAEILLSWETMRTCLERILDGKPHHCRFEQKIFERLQPTAIVGRGGNAELLNILTIGGRRENILTRAEEVVNDLC